MNNSVRNFSAMNPEEEHDKTSGKQYPTITNQYFVVSAQHFVLSAQRTVTQKRTKGKSMTHAWYILWLAKRSILG